MPPCDDGESIGSEACEKTECPNFGYAFADECRETHGVLSMDRAAFFRAAEIMQEHGQWHPDEVSDWRQRKALNLPYARG